MEALHFYTLHYISFFMWHFATFCILYQLIDYCIVFLYIGVLTFILEVPTIIPVLDYSEFYLYHWVL